MRRFATILACLLLAAPAARGEGAASADDVVRIDVVRPATEVAPPAKPKLDDVFKSMSNAARQEPKPGPEEPSNLRAIALAATALALMGLAISQWNKRRSVVKPRVAADHKKLLDELARASGLSRRQLGRLVPAARSAGLSSPLVAAICPSVLLKLAGETRSGVERSTMASLSRQIARRKR